MTLVKSRYTSLVANPASCDTCKTCSFLLESVGLKGDNFNQKFPF